MFIQYRSGYQFVLYCVMDKKKIKDCIVYKQLEKIQTTYEKFGVFRFVCYKSVESSSKFYAAI